MKSRYKNRRLPDLDVPARTGDPAGIWRRWAVEVSDTPVEAGHFVMEEAPQAVLDAFMPHFGG